MFENFSDSISPNGICVELQDSTEFHVNPEPKKIQKNFNEEKKNSKESKNFWTSFFFRSENLQNSADFWEKLKIFFLKEKFEKNFRVFSDQKWKNSGNDQIWKNFGEESGNDHKWSSGLKNESKNSKTDQKWKNFGENSGISVKISSKNEKKEKFVALLVPLPVPVLQKKKLVENKEENKEETSQISEIPKEILVLVEFCDGKFY